MSEQKRNSKAANIVVLLVAFAVTLSLVAVGTAWILSAILPDPGLEELQIVLTNMATIGGIVSGLSLAGFSLLMAGNQGVKAMTSAYGGLVHWLFLSTYALTVAASITCAIVSGSQNFTLMIWVASISAALMITGVVLTALLINSIFGWIQSSEYLRSS